MVRTRILKTYISKRIINRSVVIIHHTNKGKTSTLLSSCIVNSLNLSRCVDRFPSRSTTQRPTSLHPKAESRIRDVPAVEVQMGNLSVLEFGRRQSYFRSPLKCLSKTVKGKPDVRTRRREGHFPGVGRHETIGTKGYDLGGIRKPTFYYTGSGLPPCVRLSLRIKIVEEPTRKPFTSNIRYTLGVKDQVD